MLLLTLSSLIHEARQSEYSHKGIKKLHSTITLGHILYLVSHPKEHVIRIKFFNTASQITGTRFILFAQIGEGQDERG